jgi:hypothetical protein
MSNDSATSAHVRRAGGHLVAAVYAMRGYRVSWPLEPAPYDLLADPGAQAGIVRVQVKTCTTQQHGNWICWVMRSEYAAVPGGKRRTSYNVDAIDVLAVVDGALQVYLLPFGLVAGKTAVTLRAFEEYRVGALALG